MSSLKPPNSATSIPIISTSLAILNIPSFFMIKKKDIEMTETHANIETIPTI